MASPDAPMVPGVGQVVGRHRETADTVTLTVAPSERHPDAWIAPPRPGQFSMLSAFGAGEVPISLSRARGDGAVEHTVRAVGSVTQALCELPVGASVGVRGPFGHGWDVDGARGGDVLVVGGGIGLAPLRPVVDAVLADRSAFGTVSVLVGARTPGDLCFRSDLDAWAAVPDAQVAVTVDRLVGPGATGWTGGVGVVTTLLPGAAVAPGRTTAFVCGPEVMMRFVVRELVDLGVAPERIWASGERSMDCAVAHCGHCQLGPTLICRDGPVLPALQLLELTKVRER